MWAVDSADKEGTGHIEPQTLDPTLYSRSPSSSTEDWRMRQLAWLVPARMAGSSSSSAVRVYRSTRVRPAARAAVRTPSASSASPPSTAGSTASRCVCVQWRGRVKHSGHHRCCVGCHPT